jgi:tRNA modification GTPase
MYQKILHDDFNMENIVVTNARHLESLQKARTTLNDVLQSLHNKESGDLTALSIRYALNAIGEITGQVTNEDLLDNIFRNFCIGK